MSDEDDDEDFEELRFEDGDTVQNLEDYFYCPQFLFSHFNSSNILHLL
jgi:hypothetical protein